MLTQVVYTSRPKFDPVAPGGRQMINDIVASARRNNSETGITGFLVIGQDRLAQILEGHATSVNKTLTRILADPRHEAVRVVDMRLVPARIFKDWAMGIANRIGKADGPEGKATAFDRLTADDFVRMASASQ